jgi:hypothetical protein
MRLSETMAWEIAGELELDDVPLAAYAESLAPLVEALHAGLSFEQTERISRRVVRAAWDDELAQAVRAELAEERTDLRVRLLFVEAALSEIDLPLPRNRLARAVCDSVALRIADEQAGPPRRLRALEDYLEQVPRETWPVLVLPVAGEVAGLVGITPEEHAESARGLLDNFPENGPAVPDQATELIHLVSRALGTAARRRVMRDALGELIDAARQNGLERVPTTLAELLAEPMPSDAAEDDLWVSLVVGLLRLR